MNWEETNSSGVHLRRQTGEEAVIGFDSILNALPQPLREVFEAERAARQKELETIVAEIGYNT